MNTLNKNHTILLIDDDEDILEFLQYNLEKEGYTVLTETNPLAGIEKAKTHKPSLIFLDVMMPESDGIEICQIIRNSTIEQDTLIVMLSARSEDYTKVAAYEAGADDYIQKPIRPRLLIKKVDSLIKRITPIKVAELKGLVIDSSKYLVSVEGEEILLPKKEFELIELLASKPGKVFNREHIFNQIWGEDSYIGDRTIDVHIRKLRKKIGDNYIRTIKGVGYTFENQ